MLFRVMQCNQRVGKVLANQIRVFEEDVGK